MKHFCLLILFLKAIFVFAQSSSEISWYKQFSGTIAQYPVTVHLHKAGHTYTGFYYYESQQHPVYFIGEDTTQPNTINLMLFADREAQERLSIKINGAEAKGEWRKTPDSKPLVFEAKAKVASPVFDYIYSEGTTVLVPAMKESPGATFEAAAVWPTGNTPTELVLKKAIREAFTSTAEGGEIGALMLKGKKAYFAEYAREHKNVDAAILKESPYMYSAAETNRLMVVYQSPEILTLAHFYYVYTGGAHGNYGTTYRSYHMAKAREFEKGDILTPAGIKALHTLLPVYFRKKYGLKKDEPLTEGGLFEDKLAPNDNFFVTKKGIGFSYYPYEAGPYAIGEVMVFTPFAELKSYLQSAFVKLLE